MRLRIVPLLLAAIAAPAADRVLLLSLDGLGYKILSSDPAARELRSLHALAGRGTFTPIRTSFPSKTSAGHAAIFSGKWAGENGVFSNTNPRAPRAQYRLDETITGFRAESLAAEPIWTAAARLGHKTVAYQATQAYPFNKLSAGLDLPRPPVVLNGYQTKMLAPHRAVRPRDLVTQAQGWLWRDGELTFHITRTGTQALTITHEGYTVKVTRQRFSPLLRIGSTGAYFRLFEISASDFLLYRTSIHEPGASGIDAALMLQETGAFIGNSPTSLYRAGGLGAPLYAGGDGTAERRYLECFALVTAQMTRQMLWLDRRIQPRLFVGYYPQADDLEHVFYGLSQTGVKAVDEIRRQAYAILDRHLAQLLKRFGHIVVTSDHGMSPTTHEIHMGALLQELGWPPTHAKPNASCVFLNTADWRNGVIPVAEAASARERLATALARHPLITRVYRHAELPAFGLTGDRQPDVCFEVIPLHYPVESAKGPVVQAKAHAEGEHGFDPSREEMKAILVTSQRGVAMEAVVGIAPLVLAWLSN